MAKTLKQDFFNLPNSLTMLRILAIPLIIYFIYQPAPIFHFWAPMTFTIVSITDFFDGFLARKMRLVSVLGKFLDPLADKLLINAMLIAFVHLDRIPFWVAILIILRDTTIDSLRSLASSEGVVIAASWWGKWKTAFQMFAMMFLLVHGTYYWNLLFYKPIVDFNYLGNIVLYIALAFSLWSGIDYFYKFLKNAFPKNSESK
ncbi:CDP-diacylglycerol--glycerol-3-phosphate 3-phosphatidyltransferase [bacterium]|nr:CDP-diacylglycerol--glycerol-3-phosphate 3-phosphatidyltransferase [bacterium]